MKNLADKNQSLKATLLVALSAILYGFLGLLGTIPLLNKMSISTMLFWRFFIAGCWMLPFALKKNTRIKLSAFNTQTLITLFFLGGIGYALSSEFFFIAARYTGTGLAMVIFFSYPVLVGLLDWIVHKKKLHFSTIIIMFFMITGLFLLRDRSPETPDALGILFGIFSSLSYALYIIGSKKLTTKVLDSSISTMIISFSAALIFMIISLADHSFSFPSSPKIFLVLLILGIFITAVPIQLVLEGLKHISSMRVSIISALEPIITIFVGIFVLHEIIYSYQAIGITIILISALAAQFLKDL